MRSLCGGDISVASGVVGGVGIDIDGDGAGGVGLGSDDECVEGIAVGAREGSFGCICADVDVIGGEAINGF